MDNLKYSSPIPSGMSKLTVEGIAVFVADKLEFEIGDPVEASVGRLGGTVKIGGQYHDEIDGGSIIAKSLNDFTIFISEMTSPKRDRFTMAHELGHLMLHLAKVQEGNPDAIMRATRWVDKSDDQQQRAEWEANWFAAEFLMPRKQFSAVVSEHDVPYAASLFNVSESAAKIRASSIGAI